MAREYPAMGSILSGFKMPQLIVTARVRERTGHGESMYCHCHASAVLARGNLVSTPRPSFAIDAVNRIASAFLAAEETELGAEAWCWHREPAA